VTCFCSKNISGSAQKPDDKKSTEDEQTLNVNFAPRHSQAKYQQVQISSIKQIAFFLFAIY